MKIDLESAIAKLSVINADFIANAKDIARNQIRQFTIPKNDGRFRLIRTPPIESKIIQNAIVEILSPSLPLSNIATAYFPGASILENAKRHASNQYFTRVDIKDFFSSISFDDFVEAIKAEGLDLSYEDLDLVRVICFDVGDKLSIGFPSSPFLSNVVMKRLDRKISTSLEAIGTIALTRYSDDFIFSSNSKSIQDAALETITNQIGSSLSPKLEVNKSKTRKMSLGKGNALITGVKILRNGQLTVHPNVREEARFLLHLIETKNVDGEQLNKARGLLAYIKSVDPNLFNKLASKYFKGFSFLMPY